MPEQLHEFLIEVTVTLANNAAMPISFTVLAPDAATARTMATKSYILKNVSDDWGPPIRSVKVLRVQAIRSKVSAA